MKQYCLLTAISAFLSIAIFAQQNDSTNADKMSQAEASRKEMINTLYNERDGKKAELLAAEIVRKIDTDPLWQEEKKRRDTYRVTPLYAYLEAEDFEGFKKLFATLGDVTGAERIHFAAAGYARRATAKGIDLEYAGQIIRKEREWARRVMLDTLTSKTFNHKDYWRMFAYALFTMDYAKWLERKGQKLIAFDLMKEAMEYNRRERKEPEITDYYLSLAPEFTDENDLKKEMEALVKDGSSTAGVVDRLKTIYAKEKGSDKGFEIYFDSLNKEQVNEKMSALRATMLNEQAPVFNLKDIEGRKVSLEALKGKTVILDFWATWCGPCKASFPAMQTMVNRYKDSTDIKFLFINSWEQGDNKEKKVKDYIAGSKYTFQVLMDKNNEVVEQYKIKGIPAKFVIDKNGILRFKAAGFANDADLMNELEAMIKLAN